MTQRIEIKLKLAMYSINLKKLRDDWIINSKDQSLQNYKSSNFQFSHLNMILYTLTRLCVQLSQNDLQIVSRKSDYEYVILKNKDTMFENVYFCE